MRDTNLIIWRAEENLREAFRAMARNASEGAILEVDRACLVATGVPNAFFNPVFLYRPPDDVDSFLRRVQAFYEARGSLPWTLIVPHWDLEDPMLPAERLLDAGLISAGMVPLLVRSTQRSENWPRFHPHVMVESVQDTGTLFEFRETLAEAFGIPGYVTDLLIPELPPPSMRLYVAYLGGQVVGTGALFDTSSVGGIYNLGTHPAFRKRGIATTLVRHIIDEACWEFGLSECTIQASRAALPLLLTMGFERIGICHRYVLPEHLPPGEGAKRA
jgi:GNAT superfamily N-acetyltransferase